LFFSIFHGKKTFQSGKVGNGVVMKSGFWYFYRYLSMLRN
jgi:hypothetical protein